MSRISYIVAALGAITLASCKPSARYTFHATIDPLTGKPTSLRINEQTGQSMILKSLNTLGTNNIYLWEDPHEPDVAYKIQINLFKAAQKDPDLTNSGPITIK